MSAHATYRRLAMRLAHAGLAALRFDYLSTGDSSGHTVAAGPDKTYTLASAPMLGGILTRYMTSRFG